MTDFSQTNKKCFSGQDFISRSVQATFRYLV